MKLVTLKEMLDVCFSQLNSFYNRDEIADLSRSEIILESIVISNNQLKEDLERLFSFSRPIFVNN